MSAFLENLRTKAARAWDALTHPRATSDAGSDNGTSANSHVRVIAAIVIVLVLYYPLGMLWYQSIDDDISLQPAPEYTVQGGSKAISTVATIVSREIDHWAPNKPIWHPAAALDNMPNFQLGVLYAVSRFAVELGDYLGRVRGSSSIDPNLDQAAGLFKYDGRTWYWGQGNIIPTAKADSQYRTGIEALMRYNREVASGKTVFDKRSDNLIAFLDRVAADLGSASAVLDVKAKAGTGYFDMTSDDVFYDIKGKMYGYYMILRDLGEDFAPVLEQKNATLIWQNMLESLREGAEMRPLVVANGKQDSMLVPSHLSALGFHLLRARTQIREIGDSLQK